MKKILFDFAKYLFIFLILVFIFVSCVEIEDRGFVNDVGIDYRDDDYYVYLQILKPGSVKKELVSVKADHAHSVAQAVKSIDRHSDKLIFMGSARVIIVSSGIYEDKGRLGELTAQISQNPEFANNINLFYTKDMPKLFSGENNELIGNYIDAYFRNNRETAANIRVTLGDVKSRGGLWPDVLPEIEGKVEGLSIELF